MGNIIKKIKEKFCGWFGKKKEKGGYVEAPPSLSNQYFNSAVKSFVNSFAGNMVTQNPMISHSNNNYTFTYLDYYYTERSYFINLNLVLDDNGNPEKIEIGKGTGIELKLLNHSIKCPTKDLILYKKDDKWEITVDHENILFTVDFWIVRYKFKMIGEDYYWTMVETINPANEIPDKFRGFRDADTRIKEYEKLFNNKNWRDKVLWKYQSLNTSKNSKKK